MSFENRKSTTAGSWDVTWPASAVDSNFASYNWTTWKLIKDSWSKASDFLTPTWIWSNLTLARVAGSTYSTVQDWRNNLMSAWWVNGWEFSDLWGGNYNIAAWQWLIRTTASAVGELVFMDWAALWSTATVANTTYYIWVEYNAGSPQVAVHSTLDWNYYTDFPLGSVRNSWGILYFANWKTHVWDALSLASQRLIRVNRIERDNIIWGLIAWETGTRNLTLSAGTLWHGLTKFPIAAKNTSVSDTFDTYLWATLDTAWATQWDNTNYNLSGVKTALWTNKWANAWLYLWTDGGLVYVYGTAEFANQASAEQATAPSTIPVRIQLGWRIIWRLTFQKSASTATFTSAFQTTFTGTAATDHTSLSNLAWATSGHTGTASNLAWFDWAWATWYYTLSGTGTVIPTTVSPTFTTPALWTPASWVMTNVTGTAANLTAWTATAANGLKSATTTVSVSAATAPTTGQVLTATWASTATWQTAAWGWNWPIISWAISWSQIVTDVLEIPVSKTITAAAFRISLGVLPTWSDFICKLYKNGVEDASATIATTDSATNGLYQAVDSTFVSGSYVATDVLKVAITQIGSSVAWSNFTFSLSE